MENRTFKCPSCGRVLFKARGEFILETKCKRCDTIVSLTSIDKEFVKELNKAKNKVQK